MASYGFGTSVTDDATIAYLNEPGDVAFVNAGAVVTATNSTAIVGTSSYHYVSVSGAVVGQYNAIALGNDENDGLQRVTVRSSGEVYGGINAGIELRNASAVNNAGYIYGSSYGLSFKGNSSSLKSVVENKGTIESLFYAIFHGGQEALVLNNSGVISTEGGSPGYSLLHNGIGSDQVTNSGLMVGDIKFGNSADTYDGRKGKVQGTVSGGDGNDKLYGGSEKNTLAGGDGNDRLFGGKGNDTFAFSSELNDTLNVDKISDFHNARGDDDRFALEHGIYLGLVIGKISSDAFHLGTKAADAEDRVIYDQKHGDLYLDLDGTETNSIAIKFAEVTDNTILTNADFIVV